GVGRDRHQQRFLAINQVAGIEGRELEAMAVGDGVGGAGLDAIAAEDAAVVIDVVDLGVALGAADAFFFGIVGGLNVNAIRGTGGCAEEAGNALFQAVFVALELVQSAETFLENSALIGELLVGVVLNDGGSKHLPKSNGHAFGNAGQVAKD